MEVLKTVIGGWSRPAKRLAEARQGLPDAFRRGNQASAGFGLENPACRAYLGCMTVHFPFQNSYAALPANFFARVAPTPVDKPRLIKLNRPLARHLGLDPDQLATPEG